MRRLDLGIASYGNPEGLARALDSVIRLSKTDWRCYVIVNDHPEEAQNRAVSQVINAARMRSTRVIPIGTGGNIGYVGAVNKLFKMVETEYVAYLDHDVIIQTPGWDEELALVLDRFHEIGMVFPSGGAAPIDRGAYVEILWGVGCCWMLPTRVAAAVGWFDDQIGHHEEVDYQTRVRLQGLKIAAAKGVIVHHAAKESNDPASKKRISDGVIKWMNKWTAYFGGKALNYHSANVLRHEDWPTSALHMEEYWKQHLPNLNANPETITHNGVEYDLIKVPRLKGFYRHRII